MKRPGEIIKVVSIKRGFDPRDFAPVAFSGAGPTHAGALMEVLMLPAVLVPHEPGTLSALGLSTTDLCRDYVRTFLRRADGVGSEEPAGLLGALEARGRQELTRDNIPAEAMAFERAVDMRDMGQAYEVSVAIDDPGDVAEIVRRFHAEHERLYAHPIETEDGGAGGAAHYLARGGPTSSVVG